MKLRFTLALTAMGALAACGPIDVDLGGADGEAGAPSATGGTGVAVAGAHSVGGSSTNGTGGTYAAAGRPNDVPPSSTGGTDGYGTGGAPIAGRGPADGTGNAPGVGGAQPIGGSDGSGGFAGAPADMCWTEDIATFDGGCIDNDIFHGRGVERCDIQGASLASISFTQTCDGYSSAVVQVVCCQPDGSGGTGTGTGGGQSTAGTGSSSTGGASTGGDDSGSGGLSWAGTGSSSTGGAPNTAGISGVGGGLTGGGYAGEPDAR